MSDAKDSSASLQPWASLHYRDYSFLFLLALFATTAQQMRQAQNFYQVYELSGSAFLLGLTGLAQGVPIFALGLFGGTLADFLDRKKILLITTFGNLFVAVALGVLTLTELIQVWHILAATALTSALNIVLNPTRMAALPLDQCRRAQLQRFSRRPLHRADAWRSQPGLDEHGKRLFVQCVVLCSRRHRDRPAENSGS
jgi:Na+/melibiose symporter-like transporter